MVHDTWCPQIVQVGRLLVFIYFNVKDGGIPISYGWLMTPGVHNVQVGRLLVFISFNYR